MVLAHDTESALVAAAALANSALEPDTLTTVADLDAFFAEHGYSGSHRRTREELAEVRALRPLLRDVLTAPRDRAVEIANGMLADAGAVPQLVRHDGWDWHLHAIAPERPLAERMSVETAMAVVDLVRSDELSRLGTCAASECDGVVVDLSRNRSRRFCSTACGNREAVAAYRARHAGEP